MDENKNEVFNFENPEEDLKKLFGEDIDYEIIDFTQNETQPVIEEAKEDDDNTSVEYALPEDDKEKRFYSKIFCALSALIFIGSLSFFLVISVIDVDQTVSVTEKRKLAVRPEFSFSELFNGKWTTDFENYYSDTFPLRDELIKVSKKIESTFTRLSFGSEGSVIVKVEKDNNDFAGEGLVVDDKGETVTTKPQPETTTETENNKNIANDKDAVIQSSILIANKRAMEIFSYSDSILKNYAGLITGLADDIGESANVYSLVAPTSVEFYGTRQYRSGSHSQRDAIKQVYSMMGKNVKTVDAYSNLLENTDEYIYFRTDHHWTARGAYYAYEAFCSASGQTPKNLESYTDKGRVEGDFLGTLYNETQSDVLLSNPDYVEYFMPDDSVTGEIFSSTEMKDSFPFYVVSRAVASTNKYLAFIAGDQPLEKITTGVKNGRKIIVLKESYGNAFVPFLCSNYEEIYVTDPRHLTFNLSEFVKTNEIDDVLFINYAFGMANPYYTEALSAMDD